MPKLGEQQRPDADGQHPRGMPTADGGRPGTDRIRSNGSEPSEPMQGQETSAATANGRVTGRRAQARGFAFVGFMGAGKTTAAREFAIKFGLNHADVDREIVERTGKSIPEFFASHGEDAFREMEEDTSLELLARRSTVVSLGGGAVESPRIRSALREHLVVWCDVDAETAWARASYTDRPLARNKESFLERYRTRHDLYEQLAQVWLLTTREGVAAEAAPWIKSLAGNTSLQMLWAESPSGHYPAFVGPGALAHVPRDFPWFVIADKRAFSYHGRKLPKWVRANRDRVLTFEVKEGFKTFAGAEEILVELVEAEASRQDGVIAFGGGVIGDLAGFCAAIFHRDGIPVVQAPTTLLSQVDSAYGGKTGVNLPNAKHQVGEYHMPYAVLADTRTLSTLSARELASGFAEVIKTALIAGGALWEKVRCSPSLDPEALATLVADCARTKLTIVATDEREQGRRAYLNLGHTVGHAIEVATDYRQYTHGEAVGLGLLAVLRLAGLNSLHEEVASLLKRHHLPTSLDAKVSVERIARAVSRDKKRSFVVLDAPGYLRVGVPFRPSHVAQVVQELQAPAPSTSALA